MNWDRIEGEWKQRRGKAVHHWGKMMNDELAAIAGKYEELVGRLQEKYGIASDSSKRQLDDFKKLVIAVEEVERTAQVADGASLFNEDGGQKAQTCRSQGKIQTRPETKSVAVRQRQRVHD